MIKILKSSLEKNLYIGLTFLLAGCYNNLVGNSMDLMKEKYNYPRESRGYYLGFEDEKTQQVKECIFIYRRDHYDLLYLFKLAKLNMGADEFNKRKAERPDVGGKDFFDITDMTNACLEIDSFGNGDKITTPEERAYHFKKKFPNVTEEDLKSEFLINYK